MVSNSRFAVSVHLLVYLAHKAEGPVSSAELASSVGTHPVIVRRLLLLLQHAHLVVAHKGAGGGFRLACSPENISLREVYRAVEPAPDFGMASFNPNTKCPVGAHMAAVLARTFGRAQAQLEGELARVSIGEIMREVAPACPNKKG